ncbi:hypothetical protein COO60DRAFT_219242 [Scenedesmus sp. NREL 46B-D3]|nr:hypothetical protein COO60DRAFT_219242 [Scenedesmus sp. NREL 46B-D3]
MHRREFVGAVMMWLNTTLPASLEPGCSSGACVACCTAAACDAGSADGRASPGLLSGGPALQPPHNRNADGCHIYMMGCIAPRCWLSHVQHAGFPMPCGLVLDLAGQSPGSSSACHVAWFFMSLPCMLFWPGWRMLAGSHTVVSRRCHVNR